MAQILLIETDRWIAANICELLNNAGHKVRWCVDLQTAVNKADKEQPSIVILDLWLAGRSGVEFLYEFRSYPDWVDLPVVLFSNISSQDLGKSVTGLKHLNIAAYHYKPTTSLSQLAKTVERILLARSAAV